MTKSLYSITALALLSLYTVNGFELSSDQSGNITAAALHSDDYCLVFEDHFDTFNLKNWQVKKKE